MGAAVTTTGERSAMSGVALVFPYVRTRARNEIVFPPLGIAALASQLRLRGIETHVYDCTFRDLAWLRGELERTRPSVVGISARVSLSGASAETAAMVRRLLPDSLLVAGGPLPSPPRARLFYRRSRQP